ncbi:MAG TPA: cysteine desulfurase [Firmicutes bacterium]|nr:cysteine desulfurase [Bacillota bacterium]
MIYLDNAATTPLSEAALARMLPFLREQYGNASSLHSLGTAARRAVDGARAQVAAALGAQPGEIVFTSGGTEGDNGVLRGVCRRFAAEPVHLVVSCIEHPAVLAACRALEEDGVRVTYLPVDRLGRVSPDDVSAALSPQTKLVSVMLANNEVGTIEPVAEIARRLRGRGVLLHTDAVQAVGHIPVDVRALGVDYLTASAHKFNGPKGTGILYQRAGAELPPLAEGGGQEQGRRAGTENVAGIVAAGCALKESVAEMPASIRRLEALARLTIERLRAQIPGLRVNGDPDNRLPGLLSLTFPGVSGEALMHLLDLKGICVSTGSACAAGRQAPSSVLLALGLTRRQAEGTVRLSFGRYNTVQEAETAADTLCRLYSTLRRPPGGD